MTTRDITFWGIFLFLLIIPGGVIGWLRGRIVARAYFAIHADLHQAGIELSPADLKLLITGLNRNPQKVLSEETSAVVKSIKQPHVEALLARTKPLKSYFWIIVVVGGAALLSFSSI